MQSLGAVTGQDRRRFDWLCGDAQTLSVCWKIWARGKDRFFRESTPVRWKGVGPDSFVLRRSLPAVHQRPLMYGIRLLASPLLRSIRCINQPDTERDTLKRVVLYCRVSTDDQATTEISLDAQEAKLRAYADLYDLEVVAVIRDGQSAKSLKRRGIQKALKLLRNGEADGIAITKLDRLTRSISDWQALIDDYFSEKAGKYLYSVTDSIDTTSAAGRLVLNVLMSVSQWEREAIGERTSAALQHKMANQERCGELRYGWDLAEDGVRLVPNAREQATIERIKSLHRSGRSLRKIADQLSTDGVPTKKRRARWTHTSVNSILKRGS